MQEVTQQLGIKGRQVATVFDMHAKQAMDIEREILEHIKRPRDFKHWQQYQEMVADLKRLFTAREYAVENLVVTVGRSVIAQRLANTTTYTGIINYGALGSGSTAAANSDTQLQTEVYRKVTASTSYSTKTAFIDFFYAKADTNGTYQEFATFIDGTASANTGQLFTRVITGGWTKTSSESMTVSASYDIN